MPALPDLEQLRDGARVVSLPLVTRFRSVDAREVLLVRGPRGWAEFSPFVEYPDPESARWLEAALDFGWGEQPVRHRERIPVNATLPAVTPDRVDAVLSLFGSVRTVKVKVA